MASLTKWSPWGELRRFDWDFDRIFEDFFGPEEVESGEYCSAPAVERYRHDGSYVVKVDLPGVNPKEVHLTFENGYLTVEGERKRGEAIEESSLLRDEVCYGTFHRSLFIPEGVKGDQIKAQYHEGVLEITAPSEERFLPKKIEVEEIKR